ncbi:MAG: hypothetical protein ACD_79C00758G0005, partial [uncultured bacterium]
MKHILFYARDPGGVSALSPVIDSFKNKSQYSMGVYSKDYAYDFFLTKGIKSEKINSISDIYGLSDIDLIITGTSYNDILEKQIWDKAKASGVKTLAVLDHWVGYDRFMNQENKESCYPDYLCVIDEIALESFKKSNPHCKANLHVTGNPYFDIVKTRKKSIAENKSFKKSHFKRYDLVVLYGAEKIKGFPIEEKYGFNEYTQFRFLFDVLETLDKRIKIIFRPHPKHDKFEVISELGNYKSSHIDIMINDALNQFLLMQASDYVFGINSMVLVEAWLLDCKVCSLQASNKSESIFDLVRLNVIPNAANKNELTDFLNGKKESAYYDKSVLDNCT